MRFLLNSRRSKLGLMGNVNYTIGLMFWISVTQFWNVPAARIMKTAGFLPVIYPKTNRCVESICCHLKAWSNCFPLFFQLKDLLLLTLHFTTLLIEHSFSRHLYNSMEHLTSLLSSNCLNVVLEVLNLLYMFSKRSNFISRLASERRVSLLSRLTYLAEVCIDWSL